MNFYPGKADETKNLMKLKSSDSDLRLEGYPCFKFNKKSSLKLGKKMNLTTSTL